MKNKLTKFALSILTAVFVLTGCNKNEDDLAITIKKNQDILTFKSVEEFDSTVQKVNAMKVEERSAWEKTNGFKSFGTICDEFYAKIDFNNFKNEAACLEFVKSNNDKIQIIEHSDNSKCFETQEFDNTTRYLMNKNRMFIIGNIVYKKFEEGCVVTPISNIDMIINTEDFNSIKSNPIFTVSYLTPKSKIQKISSLSTPVQKAIKANLGASFSDWDNDHKSGTYRIEIYLNTSKYEKLMPNPDPNQGPYVGETFRNTGCLIKNYKKGLFGFSGIERFTTYNVSVTTAGNLGFVDKKSCSGTHEAINTWNAPWALLHIGYAQIYEYPYFTNVQYSAYNDEGCSVSHTY